MALARFTKAMLAGEPIEVFNFGQHVRDFTYVDDIVQGIVSVLDHPPREIPIGTRPGPRPIVRRHPGGSTTSATSVPFP